MVAQEDAPLAALGDLRGLLHDLADRVARLASHRHEDARHQREVEGHVAFVAADLRVAEVLHHVVGPLVGLAQQHRAGVVLVDEPADLLEHLVGLRQVLAAGAVAFDQVGNRVQAEAVDAHVQPEAHHPQHLLQDLRVVEVQVRLVGIEAVPVVLLGYRVPGPVGLLGVDEDDPRVRIPVVGVGPDVEVAVGTLRVGPAGLEPRVLVAGVVHHQVGDDPDAAGVRLRDELLEVPAASRTPAGRRCSRPRRSRRRAAARRRTAGSTGSPRPATAGSRASR